MHVYHHVKILAKTSIYTLVESYIETVLLGSECHGIPLQTMAFA